MINFTSGLIKYNDRYLPTRYITNINNGDNGNSAYITLANQGDRISQRPRCIIEMLSGSAEKWANAYAEAEKTNSVVDVLA